MQPRRAVVGVPRLVRKAIVAVFFCQRIALLFVLIARCVEVRRIEQAVTSIERREIILALSELGCLAALAVWILFATHNHGVDDDEDGKRAGE